VRRDIALAIEIRLGRELVFFVGMAGTTPANIDWARRKRKSSNCCIAVRMGVGRSLEQEGKTLEQAMGLPARDYAAHRGSFPLFVVSTGCVGAVTVSGAPQRVDHDIVVEALEGMCEVPLGDVALD